MTAMSRLRKIKVPTPENSTKTIFASAVLKSSMSKSPSTPICHATSIDDATASVIVLLSAKALLLGMLTMQKHSRAMMITE